MTRRASAVAVVAVFTCCLLAAGCRDLSAPEVTTTSALEVDVLATEDPVSTTVPEGTVWDDTIQEWRPTDLGGDKALIGMWEHYTNEWGPGQSLAFWTDGTLGIGWSDNGPDAENSGEAIQGYWRADGSHLWFWNGEWCEMCYTIKGDTLRVPSPDHPEGPVMVFKRDKQDAREF